LLRRQEEHGLWLAAPWGVASLSGSDHAITIDAFDALQHGLPAPTKGLTQEKNQHGFAFEQTGFAFGQVSRPWTG
jgi:hypothetical protein